MAVDDVVVPFGSGSTSFEDDGDTMDGWTVPGAPPGSPGNDGDFQIRVAADIESTGDVVDQAFSDQPQILSFLSAQFGPYPFGTGGGIVDDSDAFGFALENQARPIYAPGFFSDRISGDFVVVHEVAHQWYGDDVSVAQWKDIWLNEGFATYAEWLWSEEQGFRPRTGQLRLLLRRHRAGRPVLGGRRRRPRRRPPLRGPVVRSRCDDVAGVAQRGGR